MARNDKGQFEKGTSGNPLGKPIGTASAAKEWQDTFFEGDKDKAVEDWEKLSPGQRWSIRAKYWNFQFPQLRATDTNLSMDMTDADLDKVITGISLAHWEHVIKENNGKIKLR